MLHDGLLLPQNMAQALNHVHNRITASASDENDKKWREDQHKR